MLCVKLRVGSEMLGASFRREGGWEGEEGRRDKNVLKESLSRKPIANKMIRRDF